VRDLEQWLVALTVLGLVLGGWGIWWARAGKARGRTSLGRGLFVGTLMILGGAGLVAAFHRADGVIGLGLSAGLLVSAMVWEAPRPTRPPSEPLSLSDEA
jgi:hypothetical protein